MHLFFPNLGLDYIIQPKISSCTYDVNSQVYLSVSGMELTNYFSKMNKRCYTYDVNSEFIVRLFVLLVKIKNH